MSHLTLVMNVAPVNGFIFGFNHNPFEKAAWSGRYEKGPGDRIGFWQLSEPSPPLILCFPRGGIRKHNPVQFSSILNTCVAVSDNIPASWGARGSVDDGRKIQKSPEAQMLLFAQHGVHASRRPERVKLPCRAFVIQLQRSSSLQLSLHPGRSDTSQPSLLSLTASQAPASAGRSYWPELSPDRSGQ